MIIEISWLTICLPQTEVFGPLFLFEWNRSQAFSRRPLRGGHFLNRPGVLVFRFYLNIS
jgi:hypothetical protein